MTKAINDDIDATTHLKIGFFFASKTSKELAKKRKVLEKMTEAKLTQLAAKNGIDHDKMTNCSLGPNVFQKDNTWVRTHTHKHTHTHTLTQGNSADNTIYSRAGQETRDD